MGHSISTPTILAAPLVVLAAFAAWQTPATAADDCLSAPNAPTPKGQHWYYHLDRATRAKCWYLRPLQSAENKPAHAASAAGGTTETGASQPLVRGSVHSADSRPSQPPARRAQPVRSSSARSVPANEPAQPRAVKEASALPAPQDGAPAAAAPSSQTAAEQPITGTTIAWPDPPPASAMPTQANAFPGQASAAQASSADADTTGSIGAAQGETTRVQTAAAEPAPVTAPAPVANAPALAPAAAGTMGILVQNALVIALSLLLAGFVIAIAIGNRRRMRNFHVRSAADLPHDAASERSNAGSGVHYTEAHEGSLVPEQVTMQRPFVSAPPRQRAAANARIE